ncbi:FHA domain-containing protein [Christiangramia echinicola]|uniref:FHA domain-containing protein n=1 Tax=Christiangramia echinicola TaxID=279359 RepID=UPI00047A786E|nr:FHA domain-containing protein [Christiangramia echinicola]
MALFKCKKCGTKIPIKKEWLENGVNKVIECKSCGNKMRLNLPASEKKEQNGTVILSKDSKKSVPKRLTIRSKDTFDFYIKKEKEKYSIKFGRNPNKGIDESNQSLLINDPFISREHGIFNIFNSRGEMKITLEDLGSSNGTSINGNRINSGDIVYVQIGDEILAGNTVIKIQ